MINDYEATKPMTTDAEPVTNTASNDDVISILNGLIEICKDGQEGFQTAAEGIERSDLKSLFYEFSQQRAQFAGELQSLVQTLGGKAENAGSFSGALHRGWMNIKSAVTGKDEASILNECERGEDSAKNAYRDALKDSLPTYIYDTVQAQYASVQQAHDRVKALRDAANNTTSNSATSSR
ncbi:MAG TPA: PA2169 family four-helix-bundle protein [Pyrinomonadaceae bacterium]|nr:PA2169 family four-helix-bundle protein [Pyrinomonadaceae bacterium]